MSEETKRTAYHWFTVGYVSPDAEKWITEAGGQVLVVNIAPHLVAVALAYNPDGAWTWSHGRQEHRQGIEFWSSGEVQEASTGITLQYRSSSDPWTLAEYCSAETNYLILPDEAFDLATKQAKKSEGDSQPREPKEDNQPGESLPTWDASDLDDFDEHPF